MNATPDYGLRYLRTTPQFWFAVLITLVGGVLLAQYLGGQVRYDALRRSGWHTQAMVTGVNGATRFPARVELLFYDRRGREHRVRAAVRSPSYYVGQRLDVVYDPSWPRSFALPTELRSTHRAVEQIALSGVGSILFLLGSIGGLRILRRARTVARALRHGTPVEGRVQCVVVRPSSFQRRPTRFVQYVYPGPGGVERVAQSDLLPASAEGRFHENQELPVYLDPGRPGESVIDVWGWRPSS